MIDTGGPASEGQPAAYSTGQAAEESKEESKAVTVPELDINRFVFKYQDPRKDKDKLDRQVENWEKFKGGLDPPQ